MKENFLHFIWKQQLFDFKKLTTVQGETLKVLKPGTLNANTGPDFLNAQLKIKELLWVGTVEIHVKSSDWYAHQHEIDGNYDTVILHVVWEHDTNVFTKNNIALPTLVLKDFIDKSVLHNYYKLFTKNEHWIPCASQIVEVDSFVLNNWLERLYFERLERKALFVQSLLEETNNDFEAVLFQLLAKNFGLNVNGEAFLSLAQSFEFSLIRKVRHDKTILSALLFGQAGFLEDAGEDPYFIKLKTEYEYLKNKHQLRSLFNGQFQFFRMRPSNFPTIRLAQLIALYHKYTNLFIDVMNINSLEELYNYFSVEVDLFWKTHYTFENSSKKSNKKLTKSFIDLLIINTIIPLKFIWKRSRGEALNEDLFAILKEIKPEQNTIITKFSEVKIDVQNAFDTQALLELKSQYCNSKKCMKCAIGNFLLRKL